jgi:PASTA domain.
VTVAEPVRNLVFACIAKNPADRPTSAAHLARAAQALRHGDVQAAAASVPAILGGVVATGAATILLPRGGTTQATTVLPSAAASGAPPATPAQTSTRRRSPWTWPLIALIVLLAIVLAGTIFALVNQSGTTTPPASTDTQSSSPPPSSSPPSTPSETPTTSDYVVLNLSDYKGLSYDVAAQNLKDAGMVAAPSKNVGTAATTQKQVGTVYDMNPVGNVKKTTAVTFFVYGPLVTPSAPTDSPTLPATTPPDTVPAGQPVTVTFGHATCPAGQTLTGHQLYVDGTAQGPVHSPATTTQWTPSSTPTSQNLTYTIFCGESVESGQGPAQAVTLTPAP